MDHGPETTPLSYDLESGRFLRPVGRVGSGPGEFRQPAILHALPQDSLFVFDAGEGRFSVLAPGSYRWVRGGTWLPGTTTHLVIGPAGQVVISDPFLIDPERVGFPLHAFRPDGVPVASFGTDIARFDRRDPTAAERELTLAGPTGFWAARVDREYVLERFDWNYKVVDRIQRTAPWYKGFVPPLPFATPTKPPTGRLVGMEQDSAGLLWVTIAVADSQWWKGLAPPQTEGGSAVYPIADINELYDVVVEVVDPSLGVVLARKAYDNFVTLVGGQLLAELREDREGQPYLVLWRRRLVGMTERRLRS
jgi:hypothetical protein